MGVKPSLYISMYSLHPSAFTSQAQNNHIFVLKFDVNWVTMNYENYTEIRG